MIVAGLGMGDDVSMGDALTVTSQLWRDVDGPPQLMEQLDISSPPVVLPSVFDVTAYATAAAAVAGLALAEYVHPDRPPRVSVDSLAACAVFASEARLVTLGWERPPAWDPVAGDYRTADGWIRLHTNYAHHRLAALHALQLPDDSDRAAVERAVGERGAQELETAIVDVGGAAAALCTREQWSTSPQGRATLDERPIALTDIGTTAPGRQSAAGP